MLMKWYQYRRVWALMLMTTFCLSAWSQVTIRRYLQSKQDFIDSVAAGSIEIRHGFSYDENGTGPNAIDNNVSSTGSTLCYWDDSKDALRFTGFSAGSSETNITPNGIYLKSTPASGSNPAAGPFSQVNSSTGFTLSMEAIVNKSYSGSIARFFDATKYWEGYTKIAGNREYCFLFKPRDNLEIAKWTAVGEHSSDLQDYYTQQLGNHTPDGEWASYVILVGGGGNVEIYVNGEKKLDDSNFITYQNNGFNPTQDVLQAIQGFDLTIGNGPSWDRPRQLDGWVRNVQIVSSTSLKYISLSGIDLTTRNWEKTLFANSVNVSSKPLIVEGSDVALTPFEGYYVNWDQITLSGASWKTNSTGVFTMPSGNVVVTVPYTEDGHADNAIKMKKFCVSYDPNADEGTSVENMPTTSEYNNYWTANVETPTYTSITLSSITPTRTGYTFAGWNTKADGTGNTFTSGQSGITATGLGVMGNEYENTINLYAMWTKVDYSLMTTYATQDYSGTVIDNPSGIGLTITRAREATPDTYESATGAQMNDRVLITDANTNQDYYLYKVYYQPSGESETEIEPSNDQYTFTMPAKATTIKAIYRKFQEFNFTTNVGTGGSMVYEVNHRNAGFAESTKAMQTDVVGPKITVNSGYVLRKVTYTYTGLETPITLYEGKGTGTIALKDVTNGTFVMPAAAVTITATMLQDRTISVATTSKGTIKLSNAYGTGSQNDDNNGFLTAHTGDAITVTAKPATGYHFNTNFLSTALLPLTPAVDGVTGDETQKSKMKAVITFTMPDNDVSVGSVFTENTYTISYNANGGSSVPASQTKSHFENLTLSSEPAVWAGRTFLGWSRTTDGAVAYAAGATAGMELNATSDDPAVSPDGNTVTLYAVWKATEYSVSVDPGINGGVVSVNTSTAQKNASIQVNYTAYEGYSEPHLYYYMSGEAKTAHPITGTTFNMPDGSVTVYATFSGSHTVSKDVTVGAITNGVISVGGIDISSNSATIGSVVNVVAKPATGYRLQNLTWQKVTDGDYMKARTRASATEVDVDGKHTLTYDGTNVTYNNQTGEYVAQISGVSTDLYVAGTFVEKDDLSTTTVDIEGLGNQSWTGSAVVPDRSTYIVKFGGEVQTDYTIAWSNNVNENDLATAVITAGPNCERYKGSVTKAEVFKIVKELANATDYSTSFSSDFTYDGSPKTLTDLVVYKKVGEDKVAMTVGTGAGEYQVTYQNNTNAGTATATINIYGEGGGALIRTFNIKPQPITITAGNQTVAYGDGIATTIDKASAATLVGTDKLGSLNFAQTETSVGTHASAITVSDAKVTNAAGTNDVTSNYDITYAPGTLTVTTKQLTITAKDRTLEYGDAIPGDMTAATWYTVEGLAYGEALTSGPTGYTVVKASDDSPVTLVQGTAAGDYKLTFTGAEASTNYTINYVQGSLTITQFDLSRADVEVTGGIQPYDGTAKTATSVALKKGDWALPPADYTISYGGAANQAISGTYAIVATAQSGNVTGSATANDPLVIGKADLNSESITATIADQIYTGSQIRPALSSLKMNGTDIASTNYTVISYGTNVNVGEGQVTIRATETSETYAGTRTIPFNIVVADLSTRTTSVAYGDAALVSDPADTHRMIINGSKVTTQLNGQTLSLASSSLKVRLTNGTNDLSPDDYEVWFKKGSEEAVNTIPADGLGVYKVVIKGKENTATGTTNTTGSYETNLTLDVTMLTTLANVTWVTFYDERFNLQKPQGFNVYYVSDLTGSTISATGIGFIPRGVPVLLENVSAPVVTGDVRTLELEEDVENSFSGSPYANFVGVPSTGVRPSAEPTYILMNNYFVGCEDGAVIGAHRCYLTTPVSPARMVLTISTDRSTGISERNAVGKVERWYDLQGNRIEKPTRKGLYILNGKKVVVK